MTNQTKVTTKRPQWATYVATGFLITGFGAFALSIGYLTGAAPLIGVGSAIVALGVSAGAFGGYGHFISYR